MVNDPRTRSVTGGGHPRRATEGWTTKEERGHQPKSDKPRPTKGPDSASGNSSAKKTK